jgi:hypothetical protein
MTDRFYPLFSWRNFIVFRSYISMLIHVEFIFVCGVMFVFKFILQIWIGRYSSTICWENYYILTYNCTVIVPLSFMRWVSLSTFYYILLVKLYFILVLYCCDYNRFIIHESSHPSLPFLFCSFYMVILVFCLFYFHIYFWFICICLCVCACTCVWLRIEHRSCKSSSSSVRYVLFPPFEFWNQLVN